MFNSISEWGWVAIAWLQLILSYIGYLWYLHQRERQIRQKQPNTSVHTKADHTV